MPPAPRTSPTFTGDPYPSPANWLQWGPESGLYCSEFGLLLVFRCEVFGHAPAEGDEAVAAVAVELAEVDGHVGGDRLGLLSLEVEDAAGRAVAGDDERVVVDAALGAEALGQPPAPRSLLARELVLGTGT